MNVIVVLLGVCIVYGVEDAVVAVEVGVGVDGKVIYLHGYVLVWE